MSTHSRFLVTSATVGGHRLPDGLQVTGGVSVSAVSTSCGYSASLPGFATRTPGGYGFEPGVSAMHQHYSCAPSGRSTRRSPPR